MKDINLIQSIRIPVDLIDNNDGQIEGVKANPREMTDTEFKKLKKSLKRDPEFTALSELKVYPYKGRWVTIGGNMRLRAIRELGWAEVIAKPIPEDTDIETLNRWILLDNANFGKWDFDRLANEWEETLLADMNISVPDQPEPEAEEEAKDDNANISELLPDEPTSRVGDLYELGEHRLIVGNSLERKYLNALCGDDVVDCVITDPPYGVNYEGKTYGKKQSKTRKYNHIENDAIVQEKAFREFLTASFFCIDEHLKPGGAFYIWHADSRRAAFLCALEETGWQVRQILIWAKNCFVLSRQDYQRQHEPCIYGWKEGAAHYFTPSRSFTTIYGQDLEKLDAMSRDELREELRAIISGERIPTTIIHEQRPLRSDDHPTMKPVPLIGRSIKNSTRRGEIVLDTFGGSGTTLIAAEQLGRRCFMCELSPNYADVIIRRWEDLTGKTARKIGNIENTESKTE